MKAKGVVALRADLTNDNPEAVVLMEQLGNPDQLIPYLAVFPLDRPDDPHKIEGEYTKEQFLVLIRGLPDPAEPTSAGE